MASSHRFSGMTVAEILRLKKASILQAPLEKGSPGWQDIASLTWEEVDERAQQDVTGYRTIRKLLSDRRFDR